MADSGEGESPSRRNSSGKRFVRRARRWAELQQKRQGRRNCEDPDVPVGQNETKFHMHHPSLAFLNSQHSKDQKYRPPEPPHVYDYVEMAAFGSGAMVVDDELNYDIVAHEENQLKQNLGHTRSFPITILQPRTHEIQMPTGFPVSYGYTDHRPCQRATSNAYFYPSYLESSCPHYQSSRSSFEQRQVRPISMMKSVDSALTLITNDLLL
ncbi:hypothetical protein CRE_29266 [Caenorhabditis remanei]|uniref:Uncharacterized protein n=1 Tax=Caenorhabditis remanei TaxID=31234 RepID=E3NPG0_CAERE|nr:hypothetical protein CRE_29266 [Caenorhabditis remanei]